MMIEIATAHTGDALEEVIALAREYADWFLAEVHTRYPALDIGELSAAHDYDDIRRKFPGDHVPPQGGIFIALQDGSPCGCVALGKLDETTCEMRTLFVRPGFRGSGAGRQLAETSLSAARDRGYRRMRLDTLDFMDSAHRLYRSLGFYDVPAYREDITAPLRAHIRFFECRLA